ncbi:hypothetical protein TSMEX_000225 [Taenia solium]
MSFRWCGSNSNFLTRAVYKFRRHGSSPVGVSDFSDVSSRYRFRKKGYKSPVSSPCPNRTPARGLTGSRVGSTEIKPEDFLQSTSLYRQCDAIPIASVPRADLSRHNKKHIPNAPISAFRSKYKIHYKKTIPMQKGRGSSCSFKVKQSHNTFRQRSENPAARTISPYKRVKKAIAMLRYEKAICSHYVKTGYCRNEKNCSFSHNHNYLRLCPKFLQHSCLLGEEKCPLAHVLDPCRLPQCEFFAAGKCHRDDCPFLHVTYPENTPICPKFVRGRCEQGRECTKRHVWKSRKKSGQLAIPKASSNAPNVNEAPIAGARQVESLRDVYPVPDFIPFVLDD